MQAEHFRASLCEGEKEVDIDILITSMNSHRKFIQPIKVINRPTTKTNKIGTNSDISNPQILKSQFIVSCRSNTS